jgi:hypothetical protein
LPAWSTASRFPVVKALSPHAFPLGPMRMGSSKLPLLPCKRCPPGVPWVMPRAPSATPPAPCQNRCQIEGQNRTSDRMTERMPDRLSERMPDARKNGRIDAR